MLSITTALSNSWLLTITIVIFAKRKTHS